MKKGEKEKVRIDATICNMWQLLSCSRTQSQSIEFELKLCVELVRDLSVPIPQLPTS